MDPKLEGLWKFNTATRLLYPKVKPILQRTKSSWADLDADYKRMRKLVAASAQKKPIKIDPVCPIVLTPRLVWQTSSDSTFSLNTGRPKVKMCENSYSELVAWPSVRPLISSHLAKPSFKRGYIGKIVLESYFDAIALERMKKSFMRKSRFYPHEFEKIVLKSLKDSLRKDHEFMAQMKESIRDLYHKINKHCADYVTATDFWDYMYYMTKLEPPSSLEWSDMNFSVPARLITQMYRVPIIRARDTEDGYLVLLSEDGVISAWNSRLKMVLKKKLWLPGCSLFWFTDFVFVAAARKLIVGAGSGEFHLWSAWALEPSCRVTLIGMIPYRMEFTSVGNDTLDEKQDAQNLLAFGDGYGNIATLTLSSPRNIFQSWSKSKAISDVPTLSAEVAFSTIGVIFRKNKVHSQPVTKLLLAINNNIIISGSRNDAVHSVVIGKIAPSPIADIYNKHRRVSAVIPKDVEHLARRQIRDETVFSINPPIIDVEFSIKLKEIYVAEEKRLSIWNIYVPSRPSEIAVQFKTQIHSMTFIEELNLLHIVTMDRCVTLLDINNRTLFGTIKSSDSRIPGNNNLVTSFYSTVVSGGFLHFKFGLYYMTIARKKTEDDSYVNTHSDPIVAVLSNERFKSIVTVSETTITMWDQETGDRKFSYKIVENQAPLGASGYNEEIFNEELRIIDSESFQKVPDAFSENSKVTCAQFDQYFQRLMTGHRSGAVKLWNIFNGHLILLIKTPDGFTEVGAVHHALEYRRHPAFIIGGCDRSLDIHLDLGGQGPRVNSRKNAQTDDIRCIVSCETILATASDDGQICLWNLMADNKIIEIHPQPPTHAKDVDPNDTMVLKLVFFMQNVELTQHPGSGEVMTLLSAGPFNFIHCWYVGWQVKGIAKLLTSFRATPRRNVELTTFACQKEFGYLYAGDTGGNVYCWDVGQCPPTLTTTWIAHTKSISNIETIRFTQFMVTASEDRSVRLWSLLGECIGVYGQKRSWSLGDPNTYMHPLYHRDVFCDQAYLGSKYLKNYPTKTNEILESS